jgi:hypothetical protein
MIPKSLPGRVRSRHRFSEKIMLLESWSRLSSSRKRGDMRRQWLGALAAMLAALVCLTSSAASARIHHRARNFHHADRSNPQAQPQPAPAATSGAPAPAAARESQSPPPAAGKDAISAALAPHDSAAVLGKNVRSATGEDMGRLVDIVVDTDGRPRAAIIDFGGFLGVGSRKIAVDWSALKFSPADPKGNIITVAFTRDEVKAAPEFKEGSPIVALGAPATPPPAPAAPPPAPASPPPAAASPPPAPASPPPAAASPPPAPATPPRAEQK